MGILFSFDKCGVGGDFGGCPTIGEGLDACQHGERHSHLARHDRTIGGKNDGGKQLEDEIAANPTDGYFPLKRENFLYVGDAFRDGMAVDVTDYLAQGGSQQEVERNEDVYNIADAEGIEFRPQGKGYQYADEVESVFIKIIFGHFLDLSQTLQVRKYGGEQQVEGCGDAENKPRRFPFNISVTVAIFLKVELSAEYKREQQHGGKESVPFRAEVHKGRQP